MKKKQTVSIDKFKKDEQIRIHCHSFSMCGFIHSIKDVKYASDHMRYYNSYSNLKCVNFGLDYHNQSVCVENLIIVIKCPIFDTYLNNENLPLYIGIRTHFYPDRNRQKHVDLFASDDNIYFSKFNTREKNRNQRHFITEGTTILTKTFEFLPSRNELMNLLYNLSEKLSKNILNKVNKYL